MSSDDAAHNKRRAIVKTLLYVEGALVMTLGAWLVVLTVLDTSTELGPMLGVRFFACIAAGGLFASGHAFASGKNYGRSPSILFNLIALGVAYYQIQGRFWIGAAIILVLALPTLYLAIRIHPER